MTGRGDSTEAASTPPEPADGEAIPAPPTATCWYGGARRGGKSTATRRWVDRSDGDISVVSATVRYHIYRAAWFGWNWRILSAAHSDPMWGGWAPTRRWALRIGRHLSDKANRIGMA